jgi:MFS family permease
MGNGMIEVTGNPLVAALYPDEKTKRLNWFHAFFPIGLISGGIAGFLLGTYGGSLARWPYQLAMIYIPILVYGVMVLPQKFPKTENAEAGLPYSEMWKAVLTSPLMWLMLAMMAITTSFELGPMRWIPSVLQAGGIHGILVLVWISGWMMVLRFMSGHAVAKLSPPLACCWAAQCSPGRDSCCSASRRAPPPRSRQQPCTHSESRSSFRRWSAP